MPELHELQITRWHFSRYLHPRVPNSEYSDRTGCVCLYRLGETKLCRYQPYDLSNARLIPAQVMTEVRNAPKTLKVPAPVAVGTVTVLYIFANITYVSNVPTTNQYRTCAYIFKFAASTKSQIANAGVTVAVGFFENAKDM